MRYDAVLVLQDQAPENLGRQMVTFTGYTASIPSVFDRRFRSRENPHAVQLSFDNLALTKARAALNWEKHFEQGWERPAE